MGEEARLKKEQEAARLKKEQEAARLKKEQEAARLKRKEEEDHSKDPQTCGKWKVGQRVRISKSYHDRNLAGVHAKIESIRSSIRVWLKLEKSIGTYYDNGETAYGAYVINVKYLREATCSR